MDAQKIRTHYNSLFQNSESNISDQERKKIKKVIKTLVKKTKQNNFKNSLDIGCSFGHYTNELNKYSKKTIGIDYSDIVIEKAKDNYPNCEFIHMNGFNPSFENKFDLIFCKGFTGANTHDIDFVTKWVNKYINLLNPNGYFVFSYSTDFSGNEKNSNTANWTKDELRRFIKLVNAYNISFYFFNYFGILSFLYKRIKRIISGKKKEEFYYIIFEKK